ncbi:DUF6232 family protein [Nonomuraea sp. NPDC049784]|uniref:DUF6232 family protein n=1 Tax=Nonomuraea sp. NPDC049784 TaxID=3154361 RepID=UPI0033C8F080
MAKQKVGEIRISKRVVKIGHEVYPLANISRVQTLRLVPAGKQATFYPLQQIVILLVLLAGIGVAALVVLPELDPGFDLEATARQFTMLAAALAGIRMTYLLIVLFYRLIRKKRYALVIETAGTQYTALSGTDSSELHRIKDRIVDAIEDPPSNEQTIHVSGDVVMGDQHKQTGSDSRMTFNR